MRKTRSKPSASPAQPLAERVDPPQPSPSPRRRSGYDFVIYILLLLAGLAVYAPVRQFQFVNFDDPEYVSENLHVRQGLTPPSVGWAFTSRDGANWFPVTRLSYLVDEQLFGIDSGPQHLTNAVIHALAALLLFAFLRRATGALWPSAFVAFLFALHPLHVESVAWVSERKDVLCAFFWFLALWAYVRYTERPRAGRYLLVLLTFCLGFMAKPMIVTLPFLLLLLDVWPLRRRALLWEKVPFFVLSAAGAMIAFWAQRRSGALRTLAAFPLGLRIENALVSYVVYIAKMFWPTRLAVFYPYPREIPVWQAWLALLVLVAISLLVMRRRYLMAGWYWYLLTLAPVIGLIQVGAQARADRYMYVPMVGLAVMLAWGGAEVFRRWPWGAAAAGVAALAACAVVASAQLSYWKDSESLFGHAIAVTDGNYLAHHNLGVALAEIPGRLPEAIEHYQQALTIHPGSARAHTDLGSALSKVPGRLSDAIAEYQAALEIEPDSAIPHNDFGNTLAKVPGRLSDAIAQYQAALHINPDYAEAHNNLGVALTQISGRSEDAIREYRIALEIRPDYSQAHANLASALAEFPNRLPEAVAEYQAALRNQPRDAELHYNLAVALSKIEGKVPDAIAQFEEALRIQPDYAEAHNDLGVLLTRFRDRTPEAMAHFQTALRLKPDYADAHYNLGIALTNIPGRMPEAIAQFQEALRLRPDPEVRAALDRLRPGN